MPRTVRFEIDAPRAVSALVFGMVWLAVLVVVLDVGLHHAPFVGPHLAGWFDASSERGLGSWVSVTQTGLLALTAWGVMAVARRAGAGRARVLGWALLAAALSYLALDDGTMLHERIGSEVAHADTGLSDLAGLFPSYYWQIVLGPAFAAVGLFMAVFLWRELRTARLRARVAGAFALLAVAVALDFVDGLPEGHPADLYAAVAHALALSPATEAGLGLSGVDAVVHLSRAVEESLEIVAMTLLWAALLSHLGALVGGVAVRWAPAEAAAEAAAEAPALAAVGGDGAAVFAEPARTPAG